MADVRTYVKPVIEIFSDDRSFSTEESRNLFFLLLDRILAPEHVRIVTARLYSASRPVHTGLKHSDCPPELLSRAARHPSLILRQIAVKHSACRKEDQVYAALLGTPEPNFLRAQ